MITIIHDFVIFQVLFCATTIEKIHFGVCKTFSFILLQLIIEKLRKLAEFYKVTKPGTMKRDLKDVSATRITF
jgi:hypothetical protein